MQTFSQITAVADSSFTGALYCKDPILVIFNNFIPVEMSQQFMSTSLYKKRTWSWAIVLHIWLQIGCFLQILSSVLCFFYYNFFLVLFLKPFNAFFPISLFECKKKCQRKHSHKIISLHQQGDLLRGISWNFCIFSEKGEWERNLCIFWHDVQCVLGHLRQLDKGRTKEDVAGQKTKCYLQEMSGISFGSTGHQIILRSSGEV